MSFRNTREFICDMFLLDILGLLGAVYFHFLCRFSGKHILDGETLLETMTQFERYFRIETDDLRDTYADTKMTPERVPFEKGQLIDFKR